MIYDDDITSAERRLINSLKGKNRMEIDEILGEMKNDTL
nr:MAG TPA: hypothetical protein [Caudoviricetes sp.]